MILYQWRGVARNFGDELNGLIWPALLPGFFDNDPTTMFLGIGSVLDSRHDPGSRKIVAGAGYGGYEARPIIDKSWVVHWVRGPLTARTLGLPETLGLGDPAALLPVAGLAPSESGQAVGFMPHFESMAVGRWAEVAHAAGLLLVDPRGDPADTIRAIGRCRLLISEALHGVIVADALRVPWIGIRPLAKVHHLKWRDWAMAVDLRVALHQLPPSCLIEQMAASRLARLHHGRRLLACWQDRLDAVDAARFMDRAARALMRVAQSVPQLSDARAQDRCQTRMMERVAEMRRHPFRGMQAATSRRLRRSPLRRYDGFAYHPGSTG